MAEAMVRKQVYITREQEERLKELARAQGVSEAGLLREGLQRALDEFEHALAQTRGVWQEEIKYLRQLSEEAEKLRRRGVTGGRTWTREDLYADRFERYGR